MCRQSAFRGNSCSVFQNTRLSLKEWLEGWGWEWFCSLAPSAVAGQMDATRWGQEQKLPMILRGNNLVSETQVPRTWAMQGEYNVNVGVGGYEGVISTMPSPSLLPLYQEARIIHVRTGWVLALSMTNDHVLKDTCYREQKE